jgi:long-chain acyl-CoA synthetase
LQVAISGGAALAPEISRVFVGLGVPILQGYGLTEASPVVTVNHLDNNIPSSIGIPLPGVNVRIGDNDELLVKGPNVMLGFWNNESATAEVMDSDGWLHTGDKARIEGEHVYITGRIKDIVVLANGEKVSPTDMEMAITGDSLFSQVMVIGEARPFLSALVVLDEGQWHKLAQKQHLNEGAPDDKQLEKFLLERITVCLHEFPGYAQIRRVSRIHEQWTVDNELITPTLKIKRKSIMERYAKEIEEMYAGHTLNVKR